MFQGAAVLLDEDHSLNPTGRWSDLLKDHLSKLSALLVLVLRPSVQLVVTVMVVGTCGPEACGICHGTPRKLT